MPSRPRLVLVLGDQLDLQSAAFDGFDPQRDVVWMAEVAAESTKVWSVKARIVVFLAAMRHFREALREKGWRVDYHELGKHETLVEALRASVSELRPAQLIMVQAGEWGVQRDLEAAASELGVPLEVREDRHFLCTTAEFAEHTEGRK